MEQQTRDAIFETIDGFSSAMLSTVSSAGVIHSRPMTVARREGSTLWFATQLDGQAADEVRAFRHANVSFQGTLVYLSVSGPAEVVVDPLKVQELWKETWSGWFPEGPMESDIALIKLDAASAEIWDLRGARGLKSALRALGSFAIRQLDRLQDGHQRVAL